jgi:hypothetical protein
MLGRYEVDYEWQIGSDSREVVATYICRRLGDYLAFQLVIPSVFV